MVFPIVSKIVLICWRHRLWATIHKRIFKYIYPSHLSFYNIIYIILYIYTYNVEIYIYSQSLSFYNLHIVDYKKKSMAMVHLLLWPIISKWKKEKLSIEEQCAYSFISLIWFPLRVKTYYRQQGYWQTLGTSNKAYKLWKLSQYHCLY